MKTRWKTQDIVDALTKEGLTCNVNEPDGDVDTECIEVKTPKMPSIFIKGFNTDNYNTADTPDDVDVEMVEITDGGSSAGGLNTFDEAVVSAYGVLCRVLQSMGFTLVPTMDDYF